MIAIRSVMMISRLVSIGMFMQCLVMIGLEDLLSILGYATLKWRKVLFVPATSSKFTCLTHYLVRSLPTVISSFTSMIAKAWGTETLNSVSPKTA